MGVGVGGSPSERDQGIGRRPSGVLVPHLRVPLSISLCHLRQTQTQRVNQIWSPLDLETLLPLQDTGITGCIISD